MSRKPEPTNYTHFLTTQPLVEALWWFIENVNDEDQFRNEYFFTLRERYREECQQLRAQLAARNLADAGGTAPAMEDVPRRGRTEECPPTAKKSSRLLYDFIAALREEGADLPESDANTISALTDALDAWEGDPVNEPEMDRTIHSLWTAANTALDPNFKEDTGA